MIALWLYFTVEAVRSHPDIINPGELMDKLPLPESVLFASQVDRVFLVVHAGETRAPVVDGSLVQTCRQWLRQSRVGAQPDLSYSPMDI